MNTDLARAVTDESDRRKLLLIDDSEIVLAYEAALLSAAGFDVRDVPITLGPAELLLAWST